MNIEVDVQAAAVLRQLHNGEKRLVYAVRGAIRGTALDVQKAINERVRSEFIIRKPGFFFGSGGQAGGVAAKITNFPSITNLSATIATGTGSKGGPVLLPLFERGGERRPFTPGAKHVAVPVLGRPARPSISQGVPPAFTFAGLRFRQFKFGKVVRRRRRGRTVDETIFQEFGRLSRQLGRAQAAGIQWKGQQRTFIVPEVGVFQRFGPARGDVRLIWAFRPPFQLDRRLRFIETGERTVRQRFRLHLEQQIAETLAFQRSR